MEALPKLTPTQALLLRAAARRADGRVIPPESLRAGARASTLAGLRQRGWIEPAAHGHAITDAGYAAIGRQRPAPPDAVQKLDTTGDRQPLEGIPVRPGTKLATLVIALRHPQGATRLQLMLATGCQPIKRPFRTQRTPGHPQHVRPEARMARGFQARKRARRLSEPFRLVEPGGIEPPSASLHRADLHA